MASKIPNSLNHTFSAKATKQWSIPLVLLLIIAPLLITAFFTSFQMFREIHNFTLARREAIAFLAAATLKEKLGRIVDVGISFATRVQFRKLVAAGKWDEAIKILEGAPKDFPDIDRVSLFDPQGRLVAATPLTQEIASVIGDNFSYRDYYQGVSKNWQPYVAEAIKPAVPLGYNLVPIAVPIKSEASEVLGILLISIKLDTITAWSKQINVGNAGFVYIVDQKGHLVSHPTLSSEKDIVDFSSVPAVQKVLRGERGVEVLFNPIEHDKRVSAYEPVSSYGWGVVVVQPTRTAFVERNRAVSRIAVVWALVIVSVGFFTYRLLRDRTLILAQRDRERILLESIGDGVIAIDRDFHIILWNKSATLLSLWSRDEVLGRPMREVLRFIRESDKKEDIVFIEEAMLYGEQRAMAKNTLLIRKDGTEIPVGDSAAPVFDYSGQVAGAIIVFRDVSKEHEEQKVREEIVSQTIHDLRAPSTAIKLAAENYSDAEYLTKHPEMLKEGIELIKQANTRMLGLINSLLESARSKAGIVKREREILTNIIQSGLKEFKPIAAKKNVTITYTPSREPATVFANREQLQEVFSNLIDNAIKYNKDGGTVTITQQVESGLIKTIVRDTGVGISAENLSKIFTPYFRADAQKQRAQGTGLGLYIVKKFVEETGGSVMVNSKVGEGTTFTVSLPLAVN